MAEKVLASSTSTRTLRRAQVLAYGSRYCCAQAVLKTFSMCIFWGVYRVLYLRLRFFYETVLVASDLEVPVASRNEA